MMSLFLSLFVPKKKDRETSIYLNGRQSVLYDVSLFDSSMKMIFEDLPSVAKKFNIPVTCSHVGSWLIPFPINASPFSASLL